MERQKQKKYTVVEHLLEEAHHHQVLEDDQAQVVVHHHQVLLLQVHPHEDDMRAVQVHDKYFQPQVLIHRVIVQI